MFAPKALVVALVLCLSGCATCREHPAMCVGAALVAGAIAAHELNEREPTYRAPRHGGFKRP